jgi:flagellar biosynthesis protein FlhF
MYLRRFRKPTVQEALAAVRRELGPDALVLSTELVSAGGWRGMVGARDVQITAAVDRPVSADRPAPSPSRSDVAPADGVTARLLAAGVDRRLAETVAAAVPAAERRHLSDARLRDLLAGELAGLAAADDGFARIEVFVGPPGVGKTTTIAKLVARERAGQGRALGMIAADGFRAGAVEQLRAYAEIIGAPFKVARTPGDLERVLSHGRQPMLVDTAGRSPRDPNVADLLDVLSRRRGVRTHLVVAADTSAASARRIFDMYDSARPERLVITKIDEADSVMPLLGLARERRLPVSFLTDGQRVPEDLVRATPVLLAGALLRDSSHSQESHP